MISALRRSSSLVTRTVASAVTPLVASVVPAVGGLPTARRSLFQRESIVASFSTKARKLALFVRRAADVKASIVHMKETAYIGDVEKLVKAEFPSLKDVDPTAITLHKIGADGSLSPPLDSTMLIKDAGLQEREQLMVKVTASASATASASFPTDRRFTVNGAILPQDAERYFFLPPDISRLEKFVAAGTFFLLYGHRGSGKTTAARHLLQHVERMHGWRALKADMNAVDVQGTPEAFWRDLSEQLVLTATAMSNPIELKPFHSAGTFLRSLGAPALGGQRLIIMFDEFDMLYDAAPGIKEQFLGALRTIKQNIGDYGIRSIFAVGPSSILFLTGKSGSPFNVREAVAAPYFSLTQVSALIGQFTAATQAKLADGIAADIHEYTAGHAGLVCACGRALESSPKLRASLAAWRDYRVRKMPSAALAWPTINRMVLSVQSMPPQALQLLERAIVAGREPLLLSTTEPEEVKSVARYLTAEGWLRADEIETDRSFHISSPLVRSLAMRQLASQRRVWPSDDLPFDEVSKQLDIPAVLAAVLPFFSTVSAATMTSKLSSAPAAVVGSLHGRSVPNEAYYHFQLFSVFSHWLGSHADLYSEADVVQSGSPKQFADLLLVGRHDDAAPKHIIELVASSSSADVIEHYVRSIQYMRAHNTQRGACISFTAVAAAASVSSMDASALPWPSSEQLDAGLVAIHILHDQSWTTARVLSRQKYGHGGASKDGDVFVPLRGSS